MKVFHGSTIVVEKPLVHVGRKNLDFGQGFYVTDLREQALSWAMRPLNAGKTHWLNQYELDLQAVKTGNYRVLTFAGYDMDWLDFVLANRQGENEWMAYDIIEGGIANDRIFNTIELYASGLIPKETALERLRYEKPNNQICILNQQIVDRHLLFQDALRIQEEDQP